MDAKIRALNHLHNTKVRALMKSVNSLKEELLQSKSTSKDHRRSTLITSLRGSHRTLEFTVQVLKDELLRSDPGLTVSEINERVVKLTTGGPKRFRPKTREELLLIVEELEGKLRKAMNKKGNNAENSNNNNGENHKPNNNGSSSSSNLYNDTTSESFFSMCFNSGSLPSLPSKVISFQLISYLLSCSL